jgi:hypothetical protein
MLAAGGFIIAGMASLYSGFEATQSRYLPAHKRRAFDQEEAFGDDAVAAGRQLILRGVLLIAVGLGAIFAAHRWLDDDE